jgi:hypothetical protein
MTEAKPLGCGFEFLELVRCHIAFDAKLAIRGL